MTHDGRWPKRTMEERFWSHVDKSGECWEWTGGTRGKGYGYLYVGTWYSKSGQIDAHRYAAMMFKDDYDPALQVCHSCDNPRCVRPDHLFMGNQSDNELDKVSKGRHKWRGKCKRGHDLSVMGVPANKGTARRCGVCLAEYREGRRAS